MYALHNRVSIHTSLLSLFFYYSGLLFLWKRLTTNKMPVIVAFHDLYDKGDKTDWSHEPSLLTPLPLFCQIMNYLRRYYTIVDLNDIPKAKKGDRIAAITFDDGCRGVYRHAFPFLREANIPATVFLITDFIGSSQPPWWDRLLYQLESILNSSEEAFQHFLTSLDPPWDSAFQNKPTMESILVAYKNASGGERHSLDDLLYKHVGPFHPNAGRIFLSEEEIKEMSRAGISFGAHTKTHPILTWLDPDSLEDEIRGSKAATEAIAGQENCWFAYPDGICTERELIVVKKAGFLGAVQTYRNPEVAGLFSLPRISLGVQSTTGIRGGFSRARIEVVLANLSRSELRRHLKKALGKG